jgi:hypothetical protein
MRFDPHEMTARDPFERTVRDAHGMTARDPLEDTVPDPVGRTPRVGRRALEAVALLLLAPGLLAIRWIDDEHQAAQRQAAEHVTVVRRGGTGTLGHTRWRLLGRDSTARVRSSTAPAGAVQITLLLQVRPLDAQGVKDAGTTGYRLRDRAGHVWDAAGLLGSEGDRDPVAGQETRVTVTASVPKRLVNSLVLETRQRSPLLTRPGPVQVLRFAH